MEQAFTELAVKILFDDSSSFEEMRRTIILPENKKQWISCKPFGRSLL